MQRNKQVAMGRKKFNMDPKKVTTAVWLRAKNYDEILHGGLDWKGLNTK